MIIKVKGGFKVVSEKLDKEGKHKNLGGPYHSKSQAEARLAQVERFKHMDKGGFYYVVMKED
jgi:hypothetical protein